MNRIIIAICVGLIAWGGCDSEGPSGTRIPSLPVNYTIASDKAMYNPGDDVQLTVSPSMNGQYYVRYKFLGKVIDESTVSGTSITWSPPSDDFKGYMVELVEPATESGPERVVATIGIDVSSDWKKFPRYGFLSLFGDLNDVQINDVVENLNRHRINAIQYYDWHYKHHQPLAGTPENPTLVYRDIINREIHFNTVKKYIDAGHECNIKAMFYNLVYGALKDASYNGVKEEWYVFTDDTHSVKDRHPLSAPFISDIFLTDPTNTAWQQYLAAENQKVYQALPFDGFHMDQLGDRGTRYNYDGNTISLSEGFRPFIEAMDDATDGKYHVMNAVNQFGQRSIADAPVDVMYTEVWSPNDSYNDLAKIIIENNSLSNNRLNTVLAAYVNYDLANSAGYFNTPSVLLMDAVIFAFSGAHLELGEHMLGKEYFPNSNLAMRDDLKRNLVSYYDFLVAYQNLLRDGGTFNSPTLVSADNKLQFNNWPAQSGKVAIVGKEISDKQVMHLLNFSNAKTMQWRDNNGIQGAPLSVENLQVRFSPERPVARVWCASPDLENGASKEIEFTTTGNQIAFSIPVLQYWTMIVIEYQ